MKTNPTDLATAAQEVFAAYDAHDVEGMTALFRRWRTRSIRSQWPRERRADSWRHRRHLARLSTGRPEFSSHSTGRDLLEQGEYHR